MLHSQFHSEWKQYIAGRSGNDLLDFLMSSVLTAVLSENPYYYRLKQGEPNSGISQVVEEFQRYVSDGILASKERVISYGETAYVLWLLGIRLKPQYGPILHKRISEYFKGSSYYETGISGFRQFEYEVHIICRLIEENIKFEELGGEHEPDLLVESVEPPFVLEIKLPTGNVAKCLNKALDQICPTERKGAVVIGLDQVLARVAPSEREQQIAQWLHEAEAAVQGKNTVVYFEYLPPDSLEGSDIWHIADKNLGDEQVCSVVHLALTGELATFEHPKSQA